MCSYCLQYANTAEIVHTLLKMGKYCSKDAPKLGSNAPKMRSNYQLSINYCSKCTLHTAHKPSIYQLPKNRAHDQWRIHKMVNGGWRNQWEENDNVHVTIEGRSPNTTPSTLSGGGVSPRKAKIHSGGFQNVKDASQRLPGMN